ncbi:MAG: cytochrome P450 [Gammaproteobacteria bacterium]
MSTSPVASSPAALVAALPTPATIADPYPLYAALRPHTPVYGYRDYPPGTIPDQDEAVTAWVLMKYDEVAKAARDHETFSSRDPLQEQSSAPTLMLVNHDNPEHDRLRRLVNVAFSRREIGLMKPWIAATVSDMLRALPTDEVEVVSQLTSMIPARVMMRLLGCPDADAELCRGWATAFMLSADLSPAARERSNQSLVAYFVDKVGLLHAALETGAPPPEGLIAALLLAESEGERLSLDEVTRFCVTLVVAGAETTTFLLTNLLYNLATMPAITAALRADRSLVPAFIDESLRHGGPPQRLFRIATRDVEVGDKLIRAGDWVALFFAAANHDPAVFPDPARFDLARRNLNLQLSMGLGIHHCLGFALAKSEAQALVEATLDAYADIRPGATPPRPQATSLLTHSFDALSLRFIAES